MAGVNRKEFCSCPDPCTTGTTGLCVYCGLEVVWKSVVLDDSIKSNLRDLTREEPKVDTGGGATRTKKWERFDLCPPNAHRRWALRTGLGAAKHGENNYKKGDYKFVVSCMDHVEDHLNKFKLQGNEADDNLGAMMWNVAAIIWYEEHKPEEYAKALQFIRDGRPEETK